MPQESTARVWLDIDLGKLRRNLARIRERVAPCGVIAVLKADAYGLGVEPIARALAGAGVAGFAVAEPREALRLTGLGLPVQILGGVLRTSCQSPSRRASSIPSTVSRPRAASARRPSARAGRSNATS